MTWTVHVHDEAARQLNAIPPDRRKRILDDVVALEEDPFRGLVKPLKGREHKGKYRKVTARYCIIFKPIHATHTVEVLAILLRNERTYGEKSSRTTTPAPIIGMRPRRRRRVPRDREHQAFFKDLRGDGDTHSQTVY